MPSVKAEQNIQNTADPKVLSSKGWQYRGFAADQAKKAFDGKPETQWEHGKCPSHFVVDMKQEHTLAGFTYLPRQDGKTEGMTTRYRFEISLDGNNWTIVSEGEFGNLRANPVKQYVSFEPKKARYVRFFSTAALDGTGSSVAELELLKP